MEYVEGLKLENATFRPPESPGLAAPDGVMVTGTPAGGTDGPASVVVVVLDVLVVVLELVDVELLDDVDEDVLVLLDVLLLDDVDDDVLVLLDVLVLDDVVEDVLVLLDVLVLDDVDEDVLVLLLLDVLLLDDVLVELLVVDVSVVLVVVVTVVLVVLAGTAAVQPGSPVLLPLQRSLYPPGIPLRTHALNCVQRRVSSPPFTIVCTT